MMDVYVMTIATVVMIVNAKYASTSTVTTQYVHNVSPTPAKPLQMSVFVMKATGSVN